MVIGVTGGVGTGKSTILQILKEDYNAAIIMADDVARDLMMPGEASYTAVCQYFGSEILTGGPGSAIDRARLADIVFHDEDKLLALNSMTHPLVKDRIRSMLEQYRSEGFRYIVIETAILIQAGYLEFTDELWVIHTAYEKRVERLTASRGYSVEKINSIIKSQMDEKELESQADFVIDNSGTTQAVREQIQKYLAR